MSYVGKIYQCVACNVVQPNCEFEFNENGNQRVKCRTCHKLPKVKSVKKVLNEDEIKCINESMFDCTRCWFSKLGTEYDLKPNGERYKGCKSCIEIERHNRKNPGDIIRIERKCSGKA